MTKHPFFSIIIPIYNVSRFLDLGLKYALNQTFKDYEVILVDDGSTDGSEVMCDGLASENAVIRAFHQTNSGSGPARNKGIEEARGEYIVFFDIDDSIEETLLQECYDDLCSNSFPDMMIFSYDSYDVKYKSLVASIFEPIKCENNNDVKRIYVDHLLGLKYHNGFVWNKVYSRTFLLKNDVKFPDLLIQQEEVFNTRVYKFLNTLYLSPKVLYHYKVYDKGNTRSQFIYNRFDIYNTVKKEFLQLNSFWDLNDPRMLKYVYNRFFNSIKGTLNSFALLDSTSYYYRKRNDIMRLIMCCEETTECISNIYSLKIVPTKILPWLYFKAIEKRELFFYKILSLSDRLFQSIKWKIKTFHF